jgi:hypothetical protein
MRAEFRHVGYPDRFMETRHICAMQGCRQIVDARTPDGRKKAPKLEEAVKHFGIEVPGDVHSALPDAHKAYQILLRLRDLGAMPAFKDPYDKGPKKPAPKPRAPKRQGGLFEGPDAEAEIPDFLGVATGGIEE